MTEEMIYDGKYLKATFCVSPLFFNCWGMIIMPQIFSWDILSSETVGVYIIDIC